MMNRPLRLPMLQLTVGGGEMASRTPVVAMITGASSGIGAALAKEYARNGSRLVLLARRTDRLQEVARAVTDLGGEALFQECDVSLDGDLERAVAASLERFGRLDHVVANAGFGVGGRLKEITLDDYRRQMETNFFGVLRTVYATREALVASGGCLALLGSVMGYVALPGVSPYSISKHAVRGLANAIHHEFRADGVAVIHVAPGFVDSEIRHVNNRGEFRPESHDPVPAWLSMDTERAARTIVRAIYGRRRVAIITGHGKLIVFLKRHFPRVVHALVGHVPASSSSGGRGRRHE